MLPIDTIRDELAQRMREGPVVITSPTGSGKSTQVPRWCEGRVLVVEPRRVACKTLASRVAELEGCALGGEVGYAVRDDARRSERTRVLFVTPGIALRSMEEVLAHDVLIVDELHERAMEIDLVLALLVARHRGTLIVMSATLEAERVARYLGGRHVTAEGRLHPVETRHLHGPRQLLPDVRGLEVRVAQALEESRDQPGDVLVFLPGKGEIAAVSARLQASQVEVVPLHGGLSLRAQGRAFQPSERRKVILSTNVAETSVTVPGIGVVIDSGLVRRTRYHNGRGFLTLMPIAADSAAQRAGRAGRTGPGLCIRLWSEAAQLRPNTPPEIRRESLLPLVLAAAACGARLSDLSFLDEPPDYAVEAALEEAKALGAIVDEAITPVGRELFGLPLDAPLGRLLVEARERDTLQDAVDLVSALSVGRAIFTGPPPGGDDCDASAMIRAVRGAEKYAACAQPSALAEARGTAKRLRRAYGLRPAEGEVNRLSLAQTALGANPRAAHVARQRRGRTAFSNGGTEIELAKNSAAQRTEHHDALVVYETRAVGKDARRTRIVATCVTPIPARLIAEAQLGRERVAKVKHEGGRLMADVERVFAKKVVAKRTFEPIGALAREAVAALVERGTLFAGAAALSRARLREHGLAARLAARGLLEEPSPLGDTSLRRFLEERLEELGLESGEDLALLSPEDLVAPELPWTAQRALESAYPSEVRTPEGRFDVHLDVEAGEVTLQLVEGHSGRRVSARSLPPFPGFSVVRVDTGRGLYVVRR